MILLLPTSYRQMEGSNLQSPSVYLLSVLLLPHATSNSATCRCLTCPRMVCMGHFHDFLSLMLLLLSSQSDWGNHFFLNQNLDHLANLPRVTYKSLLLGIITSGSSIFPSFFVFPCNLKFIRTLMHRDRITDSSFVKSNFTNSMLIKPGKWVNNQNIISLSNLS